MLKDHNLLYAKNNIHQIKTTNAEYNVSNSCIHRTGNVKTKQMIYVFECIVSREFFLKLNEANVITKKSNFIRNNKNLTKSKQRLIGPPRRIETKTHRKI